MIIYIQKCNWGKLEPLDDWHTAHDRKTAVCSEILDVLTRRARKISTFFTEFWEVNTPKTSVILNADFTYDAIKNKSVCMVSLVKSRQKEGSVASYCGLRLAGKTRQI